MKKIVYVMLANAALFALAACGGNSPQPAPTGTYNPDGDHTKGPIVPKMPDDQ